MVQMRSYDDVNITLSTLAAGAVLKGALKIDGSREQGVRITKMKAACGIFGLPANDGPVVIGLTNQDLSVTEIAECFAADPQKPDDVPGSEQSMRQVFPIWFSQIQGVVNTGVNGLRTYQNIAYPWKEVQEGDGLAWFVINLDGVALGTGGVVSIASVTIGDWLGD